MQSPFVKRVIALVAGLIVSMGLILLVERLGHRASAAGRADPDATTMTDPAAQAALMKAVADYIATAPLGALLFPVWPGASGRLVGPGSPPAWRRRHRGCEVRPSSAPWSCWAR